MTGVNPMVTPEELAEMLGISVKTALRHIKAHPRCQMVGRGQIKQRYRLPYVDAVAIINGEQPLMEPPQAAPPKAKPRTVTKPHEGQRAKNGCLYAAKRK